MKTNKLQNSTVKRVYECTNTECEAKFLYTQKLSENFKKKCPACNKRSLVITSGKLNMSVFFDMKKPKTFGMQSQKNMDREVKEKGRKPFYRKSKKINYQILKNPNRYIKEGKI